MTKYQDCKNEIKRSWKLKSTQMLLVIIGATGIMRNLTEIFKTILGNIKTKELQLEAVWGSVTMLKRALGANI